MPVMATLFNDPRWPEYSGRQWVWYVTTSQSFPQLDKNNHRFDGVDFYCGSERLTGVIENCDNIRSAILRVETPSVEQLLLFFEKHSVRECKTCAGERTKIKS